jgi:hypothetical protein
MNRRSILKYLGIAPLAAVPAVAAATPDIENPRRWINEATRLGLPLDIDIARLKARVEACYSEAARQYARADQIDRYRMEHRKAMVQALIDDPEFRRAGVHEYIRSLE